MTHVTAASSSHLPRSNIQLRLGTERTVSQTHRSQTHKSPGHPQPANRSSEQAIMETLEHFTNLSPIAAHLKVQLTVHLFSVAA